MLKKVEGHSHHITALIENPFAQNTQDYKNEHEKLESDFSAFMKDFRNMNGEVFKISERVIRSEKVKKLIDWA